MRFLSLICSAIAVLQLIFIAPAFADINSTYLIQNINPSGGIYHADDSASSQQTTAQSLIALKMLGETIDEQPHLSMIQSTSDITTTELSNLIRIKRYSNIDFQDEKFELLDRQNQDGGFGSYIGYDSTPLDTANALEALGFSNDYTHDKVGPAVLYLLDHQNSDGGWSLHENESSVYVTAAVLSGLRYYTYSYNLNTVLNEGRSWLVSEKNSDGSYESKLESAYALLGIMPITVDTTVYSDTLIYLKDSQSSDFSWDSDTYTTALALQALALSKSITLPADPSQSYIQGTMIDRASGLPIKNALVSTTNAQALTDANGEFGFTLDTTGSYPITFSANGYNSASMTLNLAQIKNVNLGEIGLNPNPVNNTYASLAGFVTDKNSNQPITGANISLSGNKSYSAVTNNSGSYTITVDEDGTYELAVEADDYHSVALSISLGAGDHFDFSPTLIPLDESNVVDVSLSAVIIDGTTGDVLPNVAVELTQSNATTTITSDVNGAISTDQVVQGEVTLRINHAGYQPVTLTALLAQGQNTFSSNIELNPVDPSSLYTTVSGKIVDAELGLALEGVEIIFTGPDGKSVLTDVNGDFTAQINAAGQYDLLVSKGGYNPLSSQIQIDLGKSLILNTSMALEGSEVPVEISLTGKAVDDVTGQVIPNAKLIISTGTVTIEGVTDEQGVWLIENIPPGTVKLSFSAEGYSSTSASLLVTSGSNINIGSIPMSLLPTVSQLSGSVINQLTGEPIPGAEVSLPGLSLVATTDLNGFFSIEDISDLTFDIVVSAPGFVTNKRTLQLAEHQNVSVNLDIAAVPENETGIGIRSSVSDQFTYGAYEKALINADLYNHTDTERELWFVAQIKQADLVIQEMPIGHLALPGDIADTQLLMPANTDSLGVQFEWLTQNLSPGDYQIVLNALDLQTRMTLASTQSSVTIEASSEVTGFETNISPRFSNFEASEDVELFVKISHTSNEDISLDVNYEFLDPAGTALQSGVVPVSLEAGSKTTTISLASFPQLIGQSGKYKLRVDSQIHSDILSSESVLEVAPKVRVDAEMSVTPSFVIPDGTSKKIRIDLKLSGRNEG